MKSHKALAALILCAALFPWVGGAAATGPVAAAAATETGANLVATNLPARVSQVHDFGQQRGREAAPPRSGDAGSTDESARFRLGWPAISLPSPDESQDWLLLICAIAVIAFIVHRKSVLL